MKRDRNFYCNVIATLFTVTVIVTYFISARTVRFGIITATAGVIVYPLTYFLQSLYLERYGKNKTILMIIYSLISIIFMGILVALSSLLPVLGGKDGLETIFTTDFKLLFGLLAGFTSGQFLHLFLYQYLGRRKPRSFAVSAAISITIDSMIFIFLGYVGILTFKDCSILFVGQYVFSIIMVLFYTFCYATLIKSIEDLEVTEAKELELISQAIEEKEEKPKAKKKSIKKETKPKTKKAQ